MLMTLQPYLAALGPGLSRAIPYIFIQVKPQIVKCIPWDCANLFCFHKFCLISTPQKLGAPEKGSLTKISRALTI